ncbi:hypothetical protein LZ554_003914 [Drepanopeziza brunnea f. sp. 'monogermtubi']|nr:hypothetical protein LZ554_003914 [Drepanopeziza brunnea f. sp. 'monogermtubi']
MLRSTQVKRVSPVLENHGTNHPVARGGGVGLACPEVFEPGFESNCLPHQYLKTQHERICNYLPIPTKRL